MDAKKIAVIILSILALVLVVAAIAIGIQIAQNQAPIDSGASSKKCVSGSGEGCNDRLSFEGSSCTISTGQKGTCTNIGGNTQGLNEVLCACVIVVPNNSCTGSATASACVGKNVGDRCSGFSGTCSRTSGENCACVADSTPVPTATPTGSVPTPQPTGDPAPTSTPDPGRTPGQVQCGGSCSSTSDCKAPTGGGSAICRNGKCEQSECPAGFTIPGSICSCSFLNSCGQRCSGPLGLCQAGSVCGFLEASCSGLTYCIPSGLYNAGSSCGANTLGGSGNKYVLKPGNLPSDQSYIAASCPAGTTATPGTGGGQPPLPGTAVISDRVDAIILGLLLVVFGATLYPRARAGRE